MSTGARLGAAPPCGGSSLRGTVQDEALVGAGDRASGPWGLGVAAEGGGGERGSQTQTKRTDVLLWWRGRGWNELGEEH